MAAGVGPVTIRFYGGDKMSKKEKIDKLHKLMSSFSAEEKDRILEILQLLLEFAHSPLSI